MSETPVALDCTVPIWDRFHLVHSFVVIGTTERDGAVDLAPKHLTGPVSWENHFGFVCCETHATYRNTVRSRAFTVSNPTPDQLIETSLASAPRSDADTKPSLTAVPTVSAAAIHGVLMRGARIHLECELERIDVRNLVPRTALLAALLIEPLDDGSGT